MGQKCKPQERSNSESLNENRIQISDFNGKISTKEKTSDVYNIDETKSYIWTNKKEATYRH